MFNSQRDVAEPAEILAAFRSWCGSEDEKNDARGIVETPLSHYTSISALLGICSNGHLWFTDILHLNDPSEFSFGVEAAIDILVARCSGDQYLEKFAVEIMDEDAVLRMEDYTSYFVASFSEREDDLSQWRLYADDGCGVEIRFSAEVFNPASTKENLHVWSLPVGYGTSHLVENITPVIEKALQSAQMARAALTEMGDEAVQKFIRRWSGILYPQLALCALGAKHQAYESERERRLFVANLPPAKQHLPLFRVKGTKLIRYVSVPLGLDQPGQITEVRIGPAADGMTVDAARKLLRSIGLTGVQVQKSQIPYRKLV